MASFLEPALSINLLHSTYCVFTYDILMGRMLPLNPLHNMCMYIRIVHYPLYSVSVVIHGSHMYSMFVCMTVCMYNMSVCMSVCMYSMSVCMSVCIYSMSVCMTVCMYSMSVCMTVCMYSMSVCMTVCMYSMSVYMSVCTVCLYVQYVCMYVFYIPQGAQLWDELRMVFVRVHENRLHQPRQGYTEQCCADCTVSTQESGGRRQGENPHITPPGPSHPHHTGSE